MAPFYTPMWSEHKRILLIGSWSFSVFSSLIYQQNNKQGTYRYLFQYRESLPPIYSILMSCLSLISGDQLENTVFLFDASIEISKYKI